MKRKPIQIAAALVALSAVVSLCGCVQSPRHKAQDQLERSVAEASRSLGDTAGTAHDPIDLVHRSPLVDYSEYKTHPDAVTVFTTGWYEIKEEDGHVAVFVLARGAARSGGGWMYSDELVFRCVRLEVELGKESAAADVTRIDCPSDIRKLAHITKETPEV